MPSFVYKAADTSGRVVDGVLDGASRADVVRLLEQRNLTPLSMRSTQSQRAAEVSGDGPTRIRLRLRELLDFTRQLKVMLASGVTLLSTLGLLRQKASGDYQRLLDCVAADIQRGKTLSDAVAAHPRTFDAFYVGTVRAGEAGGIHTEALDELIAYYERRTLLRREVTNALTYPAIVIVVLVAACIVMLTCVVPQFQTIFANKDAVLPLPTQILVAASDFLKQDGWMLAVGVVLLGVAGWLAWPAPAFQRTLGRIAARIPIVGGVVYLSSVVQFSRMIALLERAGLPLLETLKVVEDMLIPGPVKELTGKIRHDVATGNSITDAANGNDVLPDLVEQMIMVGEQTGRIDETLSAAATHYEEEMRVKIRRWTTALEPALTLLVSGLVLMVALAIFLPIWESNSLMLKH